MHKDNLVTCGTWLIAGLAVLIFLGYVKYLNATHPEACPEVQYVQVTPK